ncbi:helix-turn-helix domain-containing protein [Sessilibacter corallicola]|uniref:helix-turn-helix domain-containing protein n=1 Tax=Sessilibacter corallicola TaxID=2904075 RepID=UPI001E595659|nr:helix-turn-helix transcriptional regulator [Sessilibacter corallicola]MCE2029253.1 helix-turn-helix domain-containing protein [Sessilibacter corallicola]
MKYKDAIKLHRKNLGLTQEELAKLVDWTQARLSNYERGIREPTQDDLELLAKAMNLTMIEFLCLEPQSNKLTAQEKELLTISRQLPKSVQALLLDLAQNLATKQSS